jgi:hypothetical protein
MIDVTDTDKEQKEIRENWPSRIMSKLIENRILERSAQAAVALIRTAFAPSPGKGLVDCDEGSFLIFSCEAAQLCGVSSRNFSLTTRCVTITRERRC